MVVTAKNKIKIALALTRKVNMQWRPPNFHDHLNIIHEAPAMVKNIKGMPDFGTQEDVITNRSKSFRSYKRPVPSIDRRKYFEDLKQRMSTEDAPIHELHGKFKFSLQGEFHENGEILEEEMFKAAFDMRVVGWLKIRPKFATGHFQGDLIALSSMQRWIMQRHLSRRAGTIASHKFFAENWGLSPEYVGIKVNIDDYPIPLMRYRHVRCKKDWRLSNTKKMHAMARDAGSRAWRDKAHSENLRAEDEVRNGVALDGDL
eukprot:GEMP01052558.1.p1 GENE.GEMP01052558.1~~GEMP01052558.1.p1  ORF type:complete len:259 (+),score=51.07 GEMP01052558.1:155-931(+)